MANTKKREIRSAKMAEIEKIHKKYKDEFSKVKTKTRSKVKIARAGHPLFTIGAVAQKANKCIEFIRKLHKNNLLPKPFKSDGWSMYTRNQAKLIEIHLGGVSGKPRIQVLQQICEPIVLHWEDDYKEYEQELS